jgi:GxxExxY protein
MNHSPEETNRVTEAIIGAAIEVHKALGPGFLESIYEEALCVELTLWGVSYTRQAPVAVNYKGHRIGESLLDLLVEDAVVVELKAVDGLAPVHTAQVISYLKATGCRIGLLINFNVKRLTEGIRRIAYD